MSYFIIVVTVLLLILADMWSALRQARRQRDYKATEAECARKQRDAAFAECSRLNLKFERDTAEAYQAGMEHGLAAKKVVDISGGQCYSTNCTPTIEEQECFQAIADLTDAVRRNAEKSKRRPRSNMSKTTSATQRLLNFLQTGRDITVRQAQTRFGIDNVSGRVSELRQRGYSIYLNEKTNPWTGRKFRAYRLGTPTRRIVRLGNIAKNDYFYAGF